jgi:hypothetical protein
LTPTHAAISLTPTSNFFKKKKKINQKSNPFLLEFLAALFDSHILKSSAYSCERVSSKQNRFRDKLFLKNRVAVKFRGSNAPPSRALSSDTSEPQTIDVKTEKNWRVERRHWCC